MEKVAEDLYCLEDSCRVYIIQKQEHAVLIDFGTGEVLKTLASLGIRKVDAVILTHHHRDQAEGIREAVKREIPVYVPETEYGLTAQASDMWQSREIMNNYNTRQDRFSILESVPVKVVRDYETLEFSGMEFRIFPTPGHTTGSISVLKEQEGETIAFTGDLVYGAGKLWSLAATQWSYNGGEGIPYTILSLLALREQGVSRFLPSHGRVMGAGEAVRKTVAGLKELMELRKQNPRLFLLREQPYEPITPHVLWNRTSMANSYVLLSDSGKALIVDYGYDFMAGMAAGTDRSARRPWLYNIPVLMKQFGVTSVDACIPTHYHDDHVAGMNLLKRVYGTKVICPKTYAEILKHPEQYDLPCLWYDAIEIDTVVESEGSFSWEEYEISVRELPGHTRYACAIGFTADGKRFLCTGDQYADEDGLMPNYVYKNEFSCDDFRKSADLYRSFDPDFLLSGHWSRRSPDAFYYQKLQEIGENVERLHRKLLPEKEEKRPESDFCLKLSPYQKTVEKKECFTIHASVQGSTGNIRLQLLLPDGFLAADTSQVLKGDTREADFVIEAPENEVRRARIGCRMWREGQCLGTQAEMLVTVQNKEKPKPETGRKG